MSHVPLSPIGRPRDAFLDAKSFERNREAMRAKESTLAERRAQVAAGWGPKYAERVHADGKLTTRERLEKLRDSGTALLDTSHTPGWGAPVKPRAD